MSTKKNIALQVDERELAHILLGLRFVDDDACHLTAMGRDAAKHYIYDAGNTLMNYEEINALCERLNCTPEPDEDPGVPIPTGADSWFGPLKKSAKC